MVGELDGQVAKAPAAVTFPHWNFVLMNRSAHALIAKIAFGVFAMIDSSIASTT